MKKKNFSILVVDLSTSSSTAGARIIPLVKYFKARGCWVSLLINSVTKKTYMNLLGSLKNKVSVVSFPLSDHFPTGKIMVGLEYLKRIIVAPFLKIDSDTDIIYSLTGIICDVFPSFIFKKKTGKIWVANVDNIEAPPSKKPGSFVVNFFSFLLFRLSLFFLKQADLIFITTPLEEVRKTLIESGLDSRKVFLTNNGIPFEYIKAVKKAPGRNYGAAFLGRIHKGKGVFDLVKVWRLVLKKYPPAGKLLLIGSGNREIVDKLKDTIKKEGLVSKIDLAGFVGEREKYQLLKSSQVFIYPSYYDANPISPVEALACGLPVIVYRLPIFFEHYPGGVLQLVPRGNINQLAEMTIALLKDKNDLRQLSKKGIDLAKQFSWEEIFSKQEKVVLNLLNKNER